LRPPPTHSSTLSLHDALPISPSSRPHPITERARCDLSSVRRTRGPVVAACGRVVTPPPNGPSSMVVGVSPRLEPHIHESAIMLASQSTCPHDSRRRAVTAPDTPDDPGRRTVMAALGLTGLLTGAHAI